MMNDKSWVNRTEELLKLNKSQELINSWTEFEIHHKLDENSNFELSRYNHSKLLAFLYQGAGIKLLESSTEKSIELMKKSYDMWKKIWYSEKANKNVERLRQLFNLSCMGINVDAFAEVRMILMEADLYDMQTNLLNLDWPKYLEYSVYVLLLILIRKANGWEDINYARQIIKNIENVQQQKEIEYLNLIEQSENPYPQVCWLASLLNLLEAIEIYLNYALSGKPDNVDKRIIGICRDSYELIKESNHEEKKFSVLLVEKCLLKLINISIWNNVYGISDKLDKYVELLVKESKSKPIFELWPSQQKAISKNFFDTNKTALVVQMPTSAGKTLLAKFYILQTLNLYYDAKIVYLVPTRALVNQVKRDFRSDFKDFKNIIVDIAIPFADIDPIEDKLLLSKTNVLITTPEKMDMLVRAKHPILNKLRLVIVDEAHGIQEKGRGSNLELLLSILRKENRNLRFLMLSPFINNANEIATWLGGNRAHDIYVDWKPSQQFTGIYDLEKISRGNYLGVVEYLPSSLSTAYSKPFKINIHNSTRKITKQEKSVILSNTYEKQGGVMILCTQKRYAENVCEEIMKSREIDYNKLNELETLLNLIEYEMGKDSLIYKSVARGLAYHHSALPLDIREEIEDAFANRLLNPIVATTTLAQGMNFPVSTVIFQGMSVFDENRSRELTNAEFWNIAGRAGRALTDKEGHVVVIGGKESERVQFENYLKRKNQDVLSSLIKALEVIPEDEFSLYWLKQSKELSSLLKYIYHIVLVSQPTDIEDILRGSLIYYQLSEKKNDLYAEKLVRLTRNYLVKISSDTKKKKLMESIDKTGLSNISMKYLLSQLKDYKEINITANGIFDYHNDMLSNLVKIINDIPEMDLKFSGKGRFNPELVAKITKDWVNGKSIKEISDKNIKFIADDNDRIRECGGYIYSTLINNLPWGMAAVLSAKGITSNKEEIDNEEDMLIPSYIYFGVKTKEAAALSMIGIPRFAAETLGRTWRDNIAKNSSKDIKDISDWVYSLNEQEWIKQFDNDNINKAINAYKIWKKQNSKE